MGISRYVCFVPFSLCSSLSVSFPHGPSSSLRVSAEFNPCLAEAGNKKSDGSGFGDVGHCVFVNRLKSSSVTWEGMTGALVLSADSEGVSK